MINQRDYASAGLMHPTHAGMSLHKVTGNLIDFYASGTGDKIQGKVTKNDGKSVHIKAHGGSTHKFTVSSNLPKMVKEETTINEHNFTDVEKRHLNKPKEFRNTHAVYKSNEKSKTVQGQKPANSKWSSVVVPPGSNIQPGATPYKQDTKGKETFQQYYAKRREKQKLKIIKDMPKPNLPEETTKMKSFKEFMLDEAKSTGNAFDTSGSSQFTAGGSGKSGKFDVKTTSTGTVYQRKYDAKTGETSEDEAKAAVAVKRGRGRPAGSKSGAGGSVNQANDKGDGIAYHNLRLPGSR